MGIGTRIYFFTSENSITRIPLTTFERLYKNESEERLLEFAGKRINCAVIYLEFLDRKPLEIIHADYSVVPFNSDGYIDHSEHERMMALVMKSVTLPSFEIAGNVINAVPRISQNLYNEQFKWEPTEEQLFLIMKNIFFPSLK